MFSFAAGSFSYKGQIYEINRANIEQITGKTLSETPLKLNEMTELMVNKVGELGGVITEMPMHALGFYGKPAGYMIIFCICAVAYLVGWVIMKALVPKYKPIVVE